MTDDDPNAGEGSDGRDFIFRGDDTPTDWDARTGAAPPPTPPQPVPPPPPGGYPPPAPPGGHPPPAPPGAQPPPAPPAGQAPPPPGGYAPPVGQPPPAPPGATYGAPGQPYGAPPTPRRKRWPWVVAALVLFCALPLGGCVALIAFGISEIEEREDDIGSVATEFMNRAISDENPDATDLMDGGSGCLDPADFTSALETELADADEWQTDEVSFVDRTGTGYLSNTGDPDSFVYEGRESDGFAIAEGRLLLDDVPQQDVRVLLLKPGSSWRVCTLELP